MLSVFLIYYKLNKKFFESHRVTESGGNSPMEKETSSLVSLGIVLIAIAVVITLGFGIFAVGKRLANNGQNDLVSQVDQINQSTFTDLDQQVITGTRLKGVINTLSSGNYAVLLNTLALRNSYITEAKLAGDLISTVGTDNKSPYSDCFVNSNYPSADSKGTKAANTWFVNYNALLGDARADRSKAVIASGKNNAKEAFKMETVTDAPDKDGFHLMMTNGVFNTEYEFQTDATTGNVLKNIRQSDFNKQGSTMYIADAAQFNSYCIKDSTDNYVGLAFVQIQK